MYFLIFSFLSAGLFFLAAYKLQYPPYSTVKGVRSTGAARGSPLSAWRQLFLIPVAKRIAPLIHIEAYKERRMAVQLERAGIRLSPAEYYTQAIVMSVITALAGGGFVLIFMRQMLPIAAVLAVIVYFHFFGEVKDKLKEKDKQVEGELPKFIRAIVQGLKTEKDVIKLLETYDTIAGGGLKYDIEVLIMDLKSGGYDDALLDFDKRVGNPYVSRLAKALIASGRGDNQAAALHHLLSDMAVLARETMQRELSRRPGRVKLLVIPIVIIGIGTLFYVIGLHLFQSLSGIM